MRQKQNCSQTIFYRARFIPQHSFYLSKAITVVANGDARLANTCCTVTRILGALIIKCFKLKISSHVLLPMQYMGSRSRATSYMLEEPQDLFTNVLRNIDAASKKGPKFLASLDTFQTNTAKIPNFSKCLVSKPSP